MFEWQTGRARLTCVHIQQQTQSQLVDVHEVSSANPIVIYVTGLTSNYSSKGVKIQV